MTVKIETAADNEVWACLDENQSFALIAGAGSGKTSSLVDALGRIRELQGRTLRQNGQRVACITYTERAVQVITTRLGFDDLYLVSTLHSFLWDQVGHFQDDIGEAIRLDRLPKLIATHRAKDNGGASQAAIIDVGMRPIGGAIGAWYRDCCWVVNLHSYPERQTMQRNG